MKQSNLVGGVFAVWVLAAMVSLVMTGSLVYVACHFLSKYW